VACGNFCPTQSNAIMPSDDGGQSDDTRRHDCPREKGKDSERLEDLRVDGFDQGAGIIGNVAVGFDLD
jgi:hypothetical protein